MSSTGYLFPGQGSQYEGMGKSLRDNFPVACRTFEEADDILHFNIAKLCFDGPESDLKLTVNTQPAILTVSTAVLRTLHSETEKRPVVAAGHSLGEYSALVAAGALRFEDALRLVRWRGQYMQEAVPEGEGMMAAVVGLDAVTVESLCEEAAQGEVVCPANFNTLDQIVISGHSPAVKRAMELASSRGAKFVKALPVSAPFHSPLMEPAREKLSVHLENIDISSLDVPVIANTTSDKYSEPDEVREGLAKQVIQPVQWAESMVMVAGTGVERVLELGPRKVLSGMMRRMFPDIVCQNVEDLKSLRKALG